MKSNLMSRRAAGISEALRKLSAAIITTNKWGDVLEHGDPQPEVHLR